MTATLTKTLRILLLGGTSEAAALAGRVAHMRDVSAVLSLAGRTSAPAAAPLPVRIGGFGGADGLANYLRNEDIDLVIDATHPFAARISANAIAACERQGVPRLAIERPPWTRVPGDAWDEHDNIAAAIAALPDRPTRVFSSLGKQAIGALSKAPLHHYVIRVIDPVEPPPGLAHATVITARGPFRTDDEIKLFQEHAIEFVLAKNAGGDATYAKLAAARELGIKVLMVRRPAIPERAVVHTAEDALTWIDRHQRQTSDRGV